MKQEQGLGFHPRGDIKGLPDLEDDPEDFGWVEPWSIKKRKKESGNEKGYYQTDTMLVYGR